MYHFSKSTTVLLLSVILLFGARMLHAQTPMYFKGGGTSSNTIPMNNAGSLCQQIYEPGDFNTLPMSGYITKIYMRNSAAGATGTYTDFKVAFLQNNLSAFPNTTYLSGAVTALAAPSFTVNGNATVGGWYEIQLATPFLYNNTQTLVFEISYASKTGGISGYTTTATGSKRLSNISSNTALTGNLSSIWGDFGMDVISATPCTSPPVAGITTATPGAGICPGSLVTIGLSGNAQGTGLTYEFESSASNTPFVPVSLGAAATNTTINVNPTVNTWYRAKLVCNNGAPSYSTPIQVQIASGLPGGTYTINNTLPTAGTNFNSFAAAITAMNCGITGPVTFNVTPGTPYNENITIGDIAGTSAVNKIRINGNGALVQFATTATSGERQMLTLNGTKYLSIDSLTFKTLSTTEGWGALITNGARRDSITNCTFDNSLLTSIGSATNSGIAFSGSNTTVTTAGDNGKHCYIEGNRLLSADGTGGMYYGIAIATGGNDSNIIRNNIIENYYFYGIYVNASSGTVVENNDLHKTNKTGSLTTFYGIYLTGATPGARVTGNRIHNPRAAAGTGTVYGIYNGGEGTVAEPLLIANNAIYNINQGGLIYGIYSTAAPYTQIYHNTITIDQLLTGTSANYGIYATGANTGTSIKNNIISITGGTLGIKYGFYYATAGSITEAQKNNIYVNSTQSGAQNYGYYTTAYATQALFQAAYPALEIGSTIENPQFASVVTGDLTPGNIALFGTGENLSTIVSRDILNIPRSLTPTPGAFELTSTATNEAGVLALASPTGTVCTGNQSVSVTVANGGINIINNLQVQWSLNGVAQPTVTYTTPINTLSSPLGNTATITLGTVNFTTTPMVIKAWTHLPNGVADTVNTNDTLQVTVAASLSGTFTINSAAPTTGTNYQTFTEFANDMNTYGVCGPVTANVVAGSGPYDEFVKFTNIPGTSPVNKIRINGNGAVVQFNNTLTDRQLLTLEGTRYLTIDSLTFKALNATYGWGALITANAQYDSITRCTFDLAEISGTSTLNSSGVVFSASNTTATTAGSNGSFCYIANNKILGPTGTGGPYYGLTMAGANEGNIVEGNTISNFYFYGTYTTGGTNNTFRNNDINRSTKTLVTTFYGMYFSGAMPGLKVYGNRIHDPAEASVASTSTFYGIYGSSSAGTAAERNAIYNNAIYNINQGGIVYGIYLLTTSFTDVFHNTVLIDKNLTGTSANYGIAATGTSNTSVVKNNNVSITGGTLGIKYGFYYGSATAVLDHQRNNIYVGSTQAGVQNYGYRGVAYLTQALFQAANPALEVGSVSVNPQFVNPAAGNLLPGNYTLLGNGLNLAGAVPTDITGITRMSLPTPGAYEIAPTGTDNAGTVNLINPIGSFCAGLQPVRVSVVNAGVNNINNLQIHWQVNGVSQTSYNYTATLSSIANPGQFLDTVLLGNVDFVSGTPNTIKVWTTLPNNNADILNANDTLEVDLESAAFTIDAVSDTLCPTGTTNINLTPSLGYQAGNITWQISGNGNNWTDLTSSDVTYNTGILTNDTFFRVKINGGINPCYSDSVKILVVNPQLLSSTDSSRCGPGSVVLNATANENTIIKWYDSPTSTTPLTTGPTFTTPSLAATDTFYVSASIGSVPSNCATPLVAVIATINPTPLVDLGLNISQCIDSGYHEVLDAGLHPHNVSYLWDDNSTSQIRPVGESGTYSVQVTNQYECIGYDTINVTLLNKPEVSLGNDTTICNGVVLTLDAGTDGAQYFWSTGQNTQTININATGTYSTTVTNEDGCIAMDTITVTAQGLLPSIMGINKTNNGQYTFQFTALNPQNVIGYEWDFGDQSPVEYLANPIHTYPGPGIYTVVLRLSSTCGFIIDSAAANVVSVHQLNIDQNELTVYPNPATSMAAIVNKGSLKMEAVMIYNVLGQMIQRSPADSKDRHNLNLNGLPSGLYTLQIVTDKGTVSRKLEILK